MMEKPINQKELSNILRKSDDKDWLKGLEVTINYPHLEITVELKGIQSIHQYISKEYRAWVKLEEHLKAQLYDSFNLWKRILNEFNAFIETVKIGNFQNTRSSWSNGVSRTISTLSNNKSYFTIDSEITKFLISIQKENINLYEGAFKFFTNDGGRLNFNGKLDFAGAMLAYEFQFEDRSKIPNRRRTLKSSLNKFQREFESFNREIFDAKQSFIESVDSKYNEVSKRFDQTLNIQINSFESWFNNEKENNEKFEIERKEKLDNLESLYGDKLMLSEPAKYWEDRATDLRNDGKKWLSRLLLTSGISVACLIIILISINNNTIENVFSNTGSAIRWSIVFLVIVSLLVYAIRTFAKLTFSTFHLVRDAEERKQLVYVYLALKEEKLIPTEERQLILQSIFSRSDSGLLREDSSPTMPGAGAAIEKLMGRN